MDVQQRKDWLLTELYEKGRVLVNDVSDRLHISKATVRRDLSELAAKGHAELYYGGATLMRPSDFSFQSKRQRFIDAKRTVGRLAASLVQDGDLIFLDSGTTCTEIVPNLKAKKGLSVILNSARMALELDVPGIRVILIGGQYRSDRMDTVGPLAAATLEQLRGYVAFIGADGMSMDFGPAAGDIEAAHINRTAMMNAREVILVVDHSKFTVPSLFKISDWSRITKIVTDRHPSEEWVRFLADRKIPVICEEEADESAGDVVPGS